jgi:hypothetical protein
MKYQALLSRTALQRTLVCAALAAAYSSSWALPVFTLNPTVLGGTSQVTADNILLSDFSNVTFTGATTFSERGYLSVTGFQLGGSNIANDGGLNSAYSLYFRIDATGHETSGNSSTNLQTTPTFGVFDTLTYTLFGATGNTTFGFTGNTPTATGAAPVTLATGTLAGNINSVFTVPASGGAGFSPGANAQVSFLTAVAPFFVSPVPFYNMAFTSFVNSATTVSTATGGVNGFNITNGGGSLNFAAPIPEPETYALMLAGLGVVGWVARRRKA